MTHLLVTLLLLQGPSVESLRRGLRGDEALVSYRWGDEGTAPTARVVTRDTAFAFRPRFPSAQALSSAIAVFVQLAAARSYPAAPGLRLGTALLDPVFAGLPRDITRLLIVSERDLSRLPFDVLRLADGRLALERATISLVASEAAFLAARSRAPSPSRGSGVLAFADPRFDPAASGSARQRSGSPALASLQRLPHSADEARQVTASAAASRLHLRDQATERAVREEPLDEFGIIHFATHAVVSTRSDGVTALALTPEGADDGLLTAAELARLPLHGQLVVLSACGSAGGAVLPGVGLRGLVGPLLEAGAGAVVGTLWSIGDRSVIPFVARFYRNLSRGLPPDEALRAAKHEGAVQGEPFSVWGAFVLIGDGTTPVSFR